MKTILKMLALGAMIFIAAVNAPPMLWAQDDMQLRAVMALTGASSEEELDEQEMENYLQFLSHPLRINLAGRRGLLSSGLLSRYEVASLEDYRSRNGDVLSASELAFVDGFGMDRAMALAPFISFESGRLPGALAVDSIVIRQDALCRVAFKGKEENYGAKYKTGLEGRGKISLAARTQYSDPRLFPPSSWTANSTIYGKRHFYRAVIGDYNLRFGQGLALWSGLSLSGFSSPSAFCKRPTGLSPSYSWSGTKTHRGVAAEMQIGRLSLVPFISLPGLRERWEGGKKSSLSAMPGVNLAWYGKGGQASLTAFCRRDFEGGEAAGRISGDFRWNHRGADYFGEAAWDPSCGRLALLAGSSIRIGDDWRVSGMARLYPEGYDDSFAGGARSWTRTADEAGAALGVEKAGIQLTADYALKSSDHGRRQFKAFLNIPLQLSGTMVLILRGTERIRPYEAFLKYRTDVRADLDWAGCGLSARYGDSGKDTWKGRIRVEGLLCRSISGLAYLECGKRAGSLAAYIRGTVFVVDNWDDRIYSYERDVPGAFNVPAYYGRGYSLSGVAGKKFRVGRRALLKLWFRASRVAYPLMKEPKPGRTEVRIQASASL